MSGAQNLIELEMLIQAHYMADGPVVQRSDEHRNAAQRLIDWGMCRWKAGKTYNSLATTEKGDFYVKHLLSVPYPVEKKVFTIPEAA